MDEQTQREVELTKDYLRNMSEDELEEFAYWLVVNGHGVEE